MAQTQHNPTPTEEERDPDGLLGCAKEPCVLWVTEGIRVNMQRIQKSDGGTNGSKDGNISNRYAWHVAMEMEMLTRILPALINSLREQLVCECHLFKKV
jgi:hypothetical protein